MNGFNPWEGQGDTLPAGNYSTPDDYSWWQENSDEVINAADRVACWLFPKRCREMQPQPVVVNNPPQNTTVFWVIGLLLLVVILILLFKK